MPSPFPGLDPYLEAQGYWPDFHATFMTYCREALAQQLPDNYEARIGERVKLVAVPGERPTHLGPDVALEQRSRVKAAPAPVAGTLTLEPVTVCLPVMEEVRETRIEILQRPGRFLVTVLELLSPGNKARPGMEDYLAKRLAVLSRHAHLVELDFLLAGQRLEMREPLPPGDYYALVSRHERLPQSEVYAWTLRQSLPPIPVPLKAPDPDVVLNLASVFATVFDRGRYERSIDYTVPPDVPLRGEDVSWAVEKAASWSGKR